MNERPLYLYTMFLQLAAVQAVFHLYRDYGRLRLPFNNPASAEGVPSRSRQVALKKSLLPILHDSISRVGLFLIFGNVTYFLFFRRLVWSIGYPFAKVRDSTILGNKPRPGFNPFELTGRLAVEGIMLTYLWEFATTAMTIYLSKEPVKKDAEHKPMPITNDSKDPNGSLLSGLRAKKDLLRVSNADFQTTRLFLTPIRRHMHSGSLLLYPSASQIAVLPYTRRLILKRSKPFSKRAWLRSQQSKNVSKLSALLRHRLRQRRWRWHSSASSTATPTGLLSPNPSRPTISSHPSMHL